MRMMVSSDKPTNTTAANDTEMAKGGNADGAPPAVSKKDAMAGTATKVSQSLVPTDMLDALQYQPLSTLIPVNDAVDFFPLLSPLPFTSDLLSQVPDPADVLGISAEQANQYYAKLAPSFTNRPQLPLGPFLPKHYYLQPTTVEQSALPQVEHPLLPAMILQKHVPAPSNIVLQDAAIPFEIKTTEAYLAELEASLPSFPFLDKSASDHASQAKTPSVSTKSTSKVSKEGIPTPSKTGSSKTSSTVPAPNNEDPGSGKKRKRDDELDMSPRADNIDKQQPTTPLKNQPQKNKESMDIDNTANTDAPAVQVSVELQPATPRGQRFTADKSAPNSEEPRIKKIKLIVKRNTVPQPKQSEKEDAIAEKCWNLILEILEAEDALVQTTETAGQQSSKSGKKSNASLDNEDSTSFPFTQHRHFDENGFLSLPTLRILFSYFTKLNDAEPVATNANPIQQASSLSALRKVIQEVEADDMIRFMKMLERRVRDGENLVVPLSNKVSESGSKQDGEKDELKSKEGEGSSEKDPEESNQSDVAQDESVQTCKQYLDRVSASILSGTIGFVIMSAVGIMNDAIRKQETMAMNRGVKLMKTSSNDTVDKMDYEMNENENKEKEVDPEVSNKSSSDKGFTLLPRGLISSDLIDATLNLVKQHLEHTIYSAIDITSLISVGSVINTIVPNVRKDITIIVSQMNTLLKYVSKLMSKEKFSENLMIRVCDFALGPFFVDFGSSSSTSASSASTSSSDGWGVEKICFVSMDILRQVFATSSSNRVFILQDILSNLIKLPTTKRGMRLYRLPDGKSIQMVTALILQLLQSCVQPAAWREIGREVRQLRADGVGKGGATDLITPANTTAPAEDTAMEIDGKKGKKKKGKQRAIEAEKEAEDVVMQDASVDAEGKKEIDILDKFLKTSKSAYEDSQKCAHFLLSYILSRALPSTSQSKDHSNAGTPDVKRKGSKGANGSEQMENEYKAVFENFKLDLLAVLESPEWPAAEMCLKLIVNQMLTYLDDNKKHDLASKSLAVEVLGDVACRIKTPSKIRTVSEQDPQLAAFLSSLPPKLDVLSGNAFTPEKLLHLWSLQKTVLDWIETAEIEDQALQSSRLFSLNAWVCGLFESGFETGFGEMSKEMKSLVDDLILDILDCLENEEVRSHRIQALDPLPLFDSKQSNSAVPLSILDTRPAIATILESFATRYSSLHHSFNIILFSIVMAMESNVVSLRTKALRALQHIILIDPEVLNEPRVQRAVSNRFNDPSPSVRDATIELVGKYMANHRDIAKSYFDIISERIHDSGTSVRKRTMKLLRDMYTTSLDISEDEEMMIHICLGILGRINDEEDTVKDLALKTFHELWFASFKNIHMDASTVLTNDESASVGTASGGVSFQEGFEGALHALTDNIRLSAAARQEISHRAIIMSGCIRFLRNPNMMSELLTSCLDSAKGRMNKFMVLATCYFITDYLVDDVVTLYSRRGEQGDGTPQEKLLQNVGMLHQIARTFPSLLSKHINTLRPYISMPPPVPQSPRKNAGYIDPIEVERRVAELVMQIYKCTLPVTTNLDTTLMSEVERELATTLARSSLASIRFIAGCLCTLIEHATGSWVIIGRLLTQCIGQLRQLAAMDQEGKFDQRRQLVCCNRLAIIGHIVENMSLDAVRAKLSGNASAEEVVKLLDAISKKSILMELFELTMKFASSSTIDAVVKRVAIQCVGLFWVAQPKLLFEKHSQDLISDIFTKNNIEFVHQLLLAFLDFLKREQQRLQKKKDKPEDGPINLKVLVGSAEEMGYDTIGGSMVQQYLPNILDGVFHTDHRVVTVSFEIMAMILEQGLVHPILCLPTVVAMESCPIPHISEKAYKLHYDLSHKHTSFIHTKNVECVKKVFEYLKNYAHGAVQNDVSGFVMKSGHAEGHLCKMYSIVREKRPKRNEFLMNMVKSFDLELTVGNEASLDLDFCKFVAENLASLDYKTQEEVLHIIFYINRVLSVTAETISRYVQEHEDEDESVDVNEAERYLMAKASVSMSILILLRKYLKTHYGLSESRIASFTAGGAPKSGEKPLHKGPTIGTCISWDEAASNSWACVTPQDLMAVLNNFQELLSQVEVALEDLADPVFGAVQKALHGDGGEGDGEDGEEQEKDDAMEEGGDEESTKFITPVISPLAIGKKRGGNVSKPSSRQQQIAGVKRKSKSKGTPTAQRKRRKTKTKTKAKSKYHDDDDDDENDGTTTDDADDDDFTLI